MTKIEASKAFNQGREVIYDGIDYQYISAVIYRKNPRQGKAGIRMQLELMDRTSRAVVIADPERVREKEIEQGFPNAKQ